MCVVCMICLITQIEAFITKKCVPTNVFKALFLNAIPRLEESVCGVVLFSSDVDKKVVIAFRGSTSNTQAVWQGITSLSKESIYSEYPEVSFFMTFIKHFDFVIALILKQYFANLLPNNIHISN